MEKTRSLANGVQIPSIGFGTYKSKDGEEAYQAVLAALKAGYRHIDTAALYGNEGSVGQAIKDSGIPREEIFLTTKLWNDAHSYEGAKVALAQSLERLGVDYIDLYLIHWPNPLALRDKWEETNAQTWKAMEEAYEEGKLKAIGVSNFMVHHLEALAKTAKVQPMANQIRLAPGVLQEEVTAYCQNHGIVVEAWSPLGQGELFSNETMAEIAQKHGKTIAQIAIAWSLAKGYVPLPKSVTPERIVSNLDVWDIELSPEEISQIDQITGVTQAPDPDTVNF